MTTGIIVDEKAAIHKKWGEKMKRIILLTMAFVMMLVSLVGHDRGGGHEERH
jgi:hypothetical protein